jgi:hypothetical protein
MKRFLFASAIVLAASTAFAADVGVSISVGEPGFYGRIDLGNYPPPQVINPQPIMILPQPMAVPAQPIYLRVPPGHAKNWRKYCHKYNACGQPVYFVHDDWYKKVYVPKYHEQHRPHEHVDERHDHGEERGRGEGHDHDRGHDRRD